MNSPKPAEPTNDKDAALDNLRKMFRMTMATNAALPGETKEQTGKRIARDPETAKVAAMLKCSVEQLMEGFGKDEALHTEEDYDHEAATREVSAKLTEIASQPVGVYEGDLASDLKEKSGTHQGDLVAPKQGERRSEIFADEELSGVMKANLQQARSMSAVRKPEADDDDDDSDEVTPAPKARKGSTGGTPKGKGGTPKGRR